MKVELSPAELRLIVEALDAKHNSLAVGVEGLFEQQLVNDLYNRLSDLDEQQKVSSRAIGFVDSQIKVYETTLRQKVEVRIQASIREYKTLLLAENDQTPSPSHDVVRGPVKDVEQTRIPSQKAPDGSRGTKRR